MVHHSEPQSDISMSLLSERQSSPDGVSDVSSFDDTTSSSDAEPGYDMQISLLLSIESPVVSSLITVLNATSVCRAIFSNHGEDVMPNIPYDSEWWRNMADVTKRQESTQEDFTKALIADLQILCAFLCGKMQRKLAATGGLESLFRLRKSADAEPKFTIPTILHILTELPLLRKALVSEANIDGELVTTLPVPVSSSQPTDIQRALDNTFWLAALESGTEGEAKVPYIETLADVFVVYCSNQEIELRLEIKPERYTKRSAHHIEKRLASLRNLSIRQSEIQFQLSQLSHYNGQSLVNSFDLASQALESAGKMGAAQEIKAKSNQIKDKASSLRAESEFIIRQLTISIDSLIDPEEEAQMTPYRLKALLCPNGDQDNYVKIFRGEEPDTWHYLSGSTYYKLEWENVAKFALDNDTYMAFYEKCSTDSEELAIAPSVQQFINLDNESFVDDLSSDGEGESKHDQVSDNSDYARSESTQVLLGRETSEEGYSTTNVMAAPAETHFDPIGSASKSPLVDSNTSDNDKEEESTPKIQLP